MGKATEVMLVHPVKRLLKRAVQRLRGVHDADWYRRRGAVIGARAHLGHGVSLDPTHCNLLTLGDDVVFAPNVVVLTHDAALRRREGFELTKLAPVTIGSRVFVGAGTIVLPGVTIGSDVVIAAGSVVSRDIASNSLAKGSPAAVHESLDDFAKRQASRIQDGPTYGRDELTGDYRERQREEVARASVGWSY